MSDTPEQKKPISEDSEKSTEKTSSEQTTESPSKPKVRASSNPVKPSIKPAPASTADSKSPSKAVSSSTKPSPGAKPTSKPVLVKPSAKKKTVPISSSTIKTDNKKEDDSPSVALLVIDGLAAVIAITFTVLMFQDAMPFLK